MNPQIDELIRNSKSWRSEMEALRQILLNCGLTEEYKWRQACYTHQAKNIAIIGAFKDYCGLAFFKGVLLMDEEKLLVSAGENSQSSRLLKFTGVNQIHSIEATIKAYIFEAIEVEKAGLKVEFKKSKNLDFPEELTEKMEKEPVFKAAFESLTPGRQRAYNLFFSGAKQSATRVTRIEKYVDRILKGKGINDCVCGHSKRMPNCDGSHKYIEGYK
jgi:uncharacterized protein YdeI (YjbR/CyaY-like superfamily)